MHRACGGWGAVRVGALRVVLTDGELVEPVVEEAEPVLLVSKRRPMELAACCFKVTMYR